MTSKECGAVEIILVGLFFLISEIIGFIVSRCQTYILLFPVLGLICILLGYVIYPKEKKYKNKTAMLYVEKLKRCVNNINLLEEYINSSTIEEFINKLNIFYNAGLRKEAEIILENTFKLINKEDKIKFLDLIRNFAGSSRLQEYYEKALKYNNLILELNPSDANALKNKKIIQEILKHKGIPFEDRREAVKLCKKGLKLCEKNHLEEGLELIKKTNEISPYDNRIKEELATLLRKLGKNDEIKNYIET